MARWSRIYDLQNGQLADVEQVEDELDNLIGAVNTLDEELSAIEPPTEKDAPLAEELLVHLLRRSGQETHRIRYDPDSDILKIQRHTDEGWEDALSVPADAGVTLGPDAAFAWFGGALANGAVEVGSNGNGHYIRLPNGIQICWHLIQMTVSAGQAESHSWTYPAQFSQVPSVLASGGLNVSPPANALVAARSTVGRRSAAGLSSVTIAAHNADSSQRFVSVALLAIGAWE